MYRLILSIVLVFAVAGASAASAAHGLAHGAAGAGHHADHADAHPTHTGDTGDTGRLDCCESGNSTGPKPCFGDLVSAKEVHTVSISPLMLSGFARVGIYRAGTVTAVPTGPPKV